MIKADIIQSKSESGLQLTAFNSPEDICLLRKPSEQLLHGKGAEPRARWGAEGLKRPQVSDLQCGINWLPLTLQSVRSHSV